MSESWTVIIWTSVLYLTSSFMRRSTDREVLCLSANIIRLKPGLAASQLLKGLVVFFFTGNMIEWCLPQDVNLEGVEFKSMASGSHRISSDFMWEPFAL